ncbi:MAG: branched-chain amino acid ABC transporter permease [Acetivibrionales bacterium]|jgi:branched-chain amino acid transport system permease protein
MKDMKRHILSLSHEGINKTSVRIRQLLFLILMLFVFFFPAFIKNQYILRMGILTILYGGLALSLNLVSGFLGQVSLGHAAFLGIGAYTSALLSLHFKLPFLVTASAAVLMSAIFGVLLGLPALKLSGSYLAIVSMGFCEIIRLVELNWGSLTRGPMGLTNIRRPVILGMEIRSGAGFYYLCIILVAIICFISTTLLRSYAGRAIKSIREDPVAASFMGINIFAWKVFVFSLSAGMVGLLGAFYAHYVRFIDPSVFNFDQSTSILCMVIVGGSGSIVGSFLGSLLLSVVPELLRNLSGARMLVYGLVMAAMVVFRPQGILGQKTLAQLLGMEKKYAKPDKE